MTGILEAGTIMAERFPTVRRNDDLFPEDLYEQIEQLVTNLKEDPLGIIITGRSNIGKSELLAALMGLNDKREDDDLSVSTDSESDDSDSDDESNTEITEHTFKKEGIEVVVWDCPGLQDGVSDEEIFLSNLKEKCGNKADLMLYCIDMSQRRLADEFAVHNSAVDKITRTLGPGIWSRTLVVLTRGNTYANGLITLRSKNIERDFNSAIKDWKTNFTEALKNAHIEQKVINKIEVQPAGFYTDLHLPGREHWLSNLWSYVFTTPDPDAQAKIMLLNASRLQHLSDIDEEQSTDCHTSIEQSIVITDTVLSTIIDSSVQQQRETPNSESATRPGFPVQNSQSQGQIVPKPKAPIMQRYIDGDQNSTPTKNDAEKANTHVITSLLGGILGLRKGIGLSLVFGYFKSRIQNALTWKKREDLRKPSCSESEV